MLISPLSVGSGSSSVPSRVFVAAEVGGRGDKGSGNTTTVDVQTLLKALLNISFHGVFSPRTTLASYHTKNPPSELSMSNKIVMNRKQAVFFPIF